MNIKKNIILIGLFLSSFIIYVLTLNPTVTFTDNGELAGVAYSMGVAHPSGYPLLSILGHLWSLLPLGWTVVYQLNLLSAIFVSSSVVFFYLTIKLILENLDLIIKSDAKNKITKKNKVNKSIDIIESPLKNDNIITLISVAMALVYSFSSVVWEQAVVFEVYSLQFLLINLTLYYFFKGIICTDNSNKYFAITGLLVGLSFSNHLTTILIIPATIFLYFKKPNQKFEFGNINYKQIISITAFILLGLSLYLYLPIRSISEPDFNWGYVHRSFEKFLYHIQGKQYQIWMFSGSEVAWDNFGKFIAKLPYNLGFIGIIFLFAGLIRLFKSYKEYFYYFLILTFSCILYSVNYSIHDIDVYFYLAIYALLIITGVGFLFLAEQFPKFKYLVILLPLINLSINFTENDKSENYLVYDYTRNVVDNLGKDALIISAQWDYWNSAFWYLQKVENYRPDIVLVEKELLRRTWFLHQLKNWYPEVINNCSTAKDKYLVDLEKFESGLDQNEYPFIQQNFVELLKCFIESNIDKRPVYVTFDFMNSSGDNEVLKGYNVIPAGFAFKLERNQMPYKVNLDKLKLDRLIKHPKNSKHHLESGILEVASVNLSNIGRYALVTGDIQTAEKAFNLSLQVNPLNEIAIKGLNEIRR
jgi:hypothetical protein